MNISNTMSFESAARTHVGLVRRLNEDNMLTRPEVGLWSVADGMGGHMAGEVASGLIVEALSQVEHPASGYAFLDEVCEAVQRVNRTLLARAAIMAPGAIIGATVVILLVYESHYACLWAGDSRIYLLRNGRLERLTRDHSMVQELIDSGSLTTADARSHKRSNVITRAVGVTDRLSLDMQQGAIEPDDLFLLCSDGLTGMVEDYEIEHMLKTEPIERAADALISLTLERGAKDNVTVVLVQASANPDDTLKDHRTAEFW